MKTTPHKIFTLLLACTGFNLVAQPINVPLSELNLSPSTFNTQKVRVTGELVLHPEGNVVCENPDKVLNCVLVEFAGSWKDQYQQYRVFNKNRVEIEGVFYAKNSSYEKESVEGSQMTIRLGSNMHKLAEVSSINYAEK
jgi:hypothetical protein